MTDLQPSPEQLLLPYNPWWASKQEAEAFPTLPTFRRPIFDRFYRDLKDVKQILSLTGPRRVGKSTLLKQIIRALLQEGVAPEQLIYFSLDEPRLFLSPDKEHYFEGLIRWVLSRSRNQPAYLFLDEVHRLERWELFLKKYYDLGVPLRFVISGSASSPIFKRSRESLMGRVKEYRLLPFSFREFTLFKKQDDQTFTKFIHHYSELGQKTVMVLGGVGSTPVSPDDEKSLSVPDDFNEEIERLLHLYFIEGGFPEVWEFSDLIRKQEYLFENQVQKVIFEDLVLATEFRKPDNIKRFFLSLLEQPGQELNMEKTANRIGVSRQMLEKYFPLLEMTDLVRRLPKFSKKVMKVRRGYVKCYLVDLALRNAIMKLGDGLLQDPRTLGAYAENLVFNALEAWPGMIDLSYYREKRVEVDFVVNLGAGRYLPVEVKYQESVSLADLAGVQAFLKKYRQSKGVMVTKFDSSALDSQNIFVIPLHIFLLLFG